MNTKSIPLKIFITVFILIALHVSPDGSQSVRYAEAVRALVDFGTFALPNDASHSVDVVQIGNHFYSVIAPGLPILLAPLYFLYRHIMSSLEVPINDVFWGVFTCLANVLIAAPLLGVTAVTMFDTLGKFTIDISKKLWLVFIFIFGSLAFFYSTNGFWIHVYTMSFIFIAFNLIINKKNSFQIGLIMGLAQFFDYISVLPISLLIAFWLYTNRKLKLSILTRKTMFLALGYSIFLMSLLYYNYIVTGSPFETPNSLYLKNINNYQLVHRGMFQIPPFASLWGLSISPYRGIFLYFPMTFLFIMSLLKKSFKENSEILFSFIVVGFIFLFNMTYYAWSGDSCFGPRHLVVALPFIILPTVFCPIKWIKIFGILSIFINLAGVSTNPSDNLIKNLIIFTYRGPFLHWLDFLYKTILPRYFHINIYLMTPFFLYAGVVFLIYLIWRPKSALTGK